MGIKRYGVEGGKGQGGAYMPFARAVEANGWLYVSGQVPMVNGEVIVGNIVTQSHQAIRNLLAIVTEAGYGPEHIVRCGVWLMMRAILLRLMAFFASILGRIRRLGLALRRRWWWIARWRSIAWLIRSLRSKASSSRGPGWKHI